MHTAPSYYIIYEPLTITAPIAPCPKPIIHPSVTTLGFGNTIASNHLQESNSIGVHRRLKIPWGFLVVNLRCKRVLRYITTPHPPSPVLVGVGLSVIPSLSRPPSVCSPVSRLCFAVAVAVVVAVAVAVSVRAVAFVVIAWSKSWVLRHEVSARTSGIYLSWRTCMA